MHDAAVAGTVEGGTGDLLTVEQDVVAPRDRYGNANAMQCVGGEMHAVLKHLLHVRLTADEGKHDVALIGVDAAATTLAARDEHAVLAAVVHVHLVLQQLVAAYDDGRLGLPDEEIVVVAEVTGHIRLDGKVVGDGGQRLLLG